MSTYTVIRETCPCGAIIEVRGEYTSRHLTAFHEQHKECTQKPQRHILTLPAFTEEV